MTKEYKNLLSRIKKIKKNFSKIINLKNEFSERNQDWIKSFILLCHSELENYFESICLTIISKCKEKYDTKLIIEQPLFSLVVMSNKNFKENDNTHNTVVNRLNSIYSIYNESIRNNHGIKEENIEKILPPIGITLEEINNIDNTLLSQLTSYGRKRGACAHTTQKTFWRIADEVVSIDNIVNSIEKLDLKFYNTIKAI